MLPLSRSWDLDEPKNKFRTEIMHLEVQERRRVLTESWHQLFQSVIDCHPWCLSLLFDICFIHKCFLKSSDLIVAENLFSCCSFLISCTIVSHTGSRAPRDSLLTQRSHRRNWTDFSVSARFWPSFSLFLFFFPPVQQKSKRSLPKREWNCSKMKKFRSTETQMRARFLLSLFAESNRAGVL